MTNPEYHRRYRLEHKERLKAQRLRREALARGEEPPPLAARETQPPPVQRLLRLSPAQDAALKAKAAATRCSIAHLLRQAVEILLTDQGKP